MDSSDVSRSPSLQSTPSQSTAPSSSPEKEACELSSGFLSQGAIDHYGRWRPSYHLMPAVGWMNDPCAPGYDPRTGTYMVSFQWNPSGPDWGDISWGTAVSKDMVSWTILDEPTMSPDTAYDGLGVFTGCLIPNSRAADNDLTIAYTSVSHLPIHHTLQHVRGSESLSLAISRNNGKSWRKLNSNPILPGEPEGLNVTGWRDPFVAPWPSLARQLGYDAEQTLFGIISGGVRDITPTSFLYAINSENLAQWKYLGPLVDVGLNKKLSRWSGDLGTNWEVTNFLTLKDKFRSDVQLDFLVMGTEGCLPSPSALEGLEATSGPLRPIRQQLWMSGTLRKAYCRSGCASSSNASSSSPVQLSHSFGGHLDHGCYYAANSFLDPRSGTQVVWGWIGEDDLCDDLRHKQGWSGLLSLPRGLGIQTLEHVVRASASRLETITNFEYEEDEHGTFTARTLGSEPLQSVQAKLRKRPGSKQSRLANRSLDKQGSKVGFSDSAFQTRQWEIQCSLRLSASCRKIGFTFGGLPYCRNSTTMTFQPSIETFSIIRPSFSRADSDVLINSSPEVAPHTLFTRRDPSTGVEDTELLEIHAWRDNSVLEVFVNGRTAISTRIYAAGDDCRMDFFSDDADAAGASELIDATLWDGIGVP